MTFTEKVVLVAGGTGGLGRAVTLAFLNEDARALVTFRNDQELAALKNAAGETPGLTGYRIDVTEDAVVEQLIEKILADHGRLDALVNTVGGYAGGIKLWDSDTATLDRMLALNLRSGFTLARAAAKAMLREGKGAIVNVAAKAALDHGAGLGAYAHRRRRPWL